MNKPTQKIFVRKVWMTNGRSAEEDHIGVHLHSSADAMHKKHFIFVMHKNGFIKRPRKDIEQSFGSTVA